MIGLQTPNFKLQTLLLPLFLLLFAGLGWGKTLLDVKAGYEDVVNVGQWAPVRVTVSDPVTQNARLTLEVPGGDTGRMAISQNVAIGPEAQTFVIYAPLAGSADAIRVRCIRARDGQLLASFPKEEDELAGVSYAYGNATDLVLVSGNAAVLRGFRGESGKQTIAPSPIDVSRLPRSPIGYDSVQCVVLIAPDLSRMSADQQEALVTWLKLGGLLIYWPGGDAIPADSALARALPCTIGEPGNHTVAPATLRKEGLPDRFSNLPSRALSPRGQGRATPYFDSDSALASIVGPIGAGRALVLASDPSVLQFNNGPDKFWMRQFRVLSPTLGIDRGYQYGDPTSAAASTALDVVGKIPGAGSFGFEYVALTLALMALVVGPVDYFVLKRLGKPAWTWATTIGWITLITTGALFIGHFFRSGDLHFHTLQVLEQVDDQVLMREDIALIYAPQSRLHELVSPENVWWRPISALQRYGRDTIGTPFSFHQTQKGNLPEPMWVNVWSYRFLRGQRFEPQPGIVKATIRAIDPGRRLVDINIQNLTTHRLRRVRVFLPDGYRLTQPIDLDASQSLQLHFPSLELALANTAGDNTFNEDGLIVSSDDNVLKIHPRMPQPGNLGKDRKAGRGNPPYPQSLDLGGASAVVQPNKTDSTPERTMVGFALITGELADPVSDLSIDPSNAKTEHRAFFRAVIPAEGFDP